MYVQDNGRGFQMAHLSPDHLGLGIMRERAAGVGATVEIDSQPGSGTRIRVLWQRCANKERMEHDTD